jgi:nitrate reductase NapAB chaperone NapD
MSIASVVVEIEDGADQGVMEHLTKIPRISVYGMTKNQIVTVIEGESPAAVQDTLKELQGLDNVLGVYPVYVGDDD